MKKIIINLWSTFWIFRQIIWEKNTKKFVLLHKTSPNIMICQVSVFFFSPPLADFVMPPQSVTSGGNGEQYHDLNWDPGKHLPPWCNIAIKITSIACTKYFYKADANTKSMWLKALRLTSPSISKKYITWHIIKSINLFQAETISVILNYTNSTRNILLVLAVIQTHCMLNLSIRLLFAKIHFEILLLGIDTTSVFLWTKLFARICLDRQPMLIHPYKVTY